MAKGRSPNYPQLTISEALERVRHIYKKEHLHPAPKEVIAQHLGYNSINGSSLTMFATLRRYGLLEAIDDKLKVTRDAVTLMELSPTDPEYRAALSRAAWAPELFSELRESLGETMPSEANLRHMLILKGFFPKAADDVIRVYRENAELVKATENDYTGHAQVEDGADLMKQHIQESIPVTPRVVEAAGFSGPMPGKRYPMDISVARGVFAELAIKGDLRKEDIEKLKRQVARQIDSIADGLEDGDL